MRASVGVMDVRPAAGRALPRAARSWFVLGLAFVVVHVVIAAINLAGTPSDSIDAVTGLYRQWMDLWRDHGTLVGIDTEWVYPIGGLAPMMIAFVAGDDAYGFVWLLLVFALDAVAFVPLVRRSPLAAWWWLAFLVALGPVGFVRLDTIAVPIALLAVLWIDSRPVVASVLFTVAAWIKVWPAAMVAAMVVAGRRTAAVIAAAAITCAAVLGVAVLAGGRANLFSFVTDQAGRGLQIESPIALPWLGLAGAHIGGGYVYFDDTLLDFEVTGPGAPTAASVMSLVLAVAVLAVVLLGVFARRRRVAPATVLSLVATGLVVSVIAFNKVGSPQYFTWLVAPVVLGLVSGRVSFRMPAVIALVMAVLTQLVYPWNYDGVWQLQPVMLAVLGVRDVLELVLYGWVLVALIRVPSAHVGRHTAPIPIIGAQSETRYQ